MEREEAIPDENQLAADVDVVLDYGSGIGLEPDQQQAVPWFAIGVLVRDADRFPERFGRGRFGTRRNDEYLPEAGAEGHERPSDSLDSVVRVVNQVRVRVFGGLADGFKKQCLSGPEIGEHLPISVPERAGDDSTENRNRQREERPDRVACPLSKRCPRGVAFEMGCHVLCKVKVGPRNEFVSQRRVHRRERDRLNALDRALSTLDIWRPFKNWSPVV